MKEFGQIEVENCLALFWEEEARKTVEKESKVTQNTGRDTELVISRYSSFVFEKGP